MSKPHEDTPKPKRSNRVVFTCRDCGCKHFYTIYSRTLATGQIRRRRECRNCGRTIYTIERIELS